MLLLVICRKSVINAFYYLGFDFCCMNPIQNLTMSTNQQIGGKVGLHLEELRDEL